MLDQIRDPERAAGTERGVAFGEDIVPFSVRAQVVEDGRCQDDFWSSMDRQEWHYPLCADLYARLKGMRP
jgi:hypothetical protein